jgi:hypothetical protein
VEVQLVLIFGSITGAVIWLSVIASTAAKHRVALVAAYMRSSGGVGIYAIKTPYIVGLMPPGQGLFLGSIVQGGVMGQIVPKHLLDGATVGADVQTTTKGRIGGAGGRAALGGIIFGPVGAIVGASGSRSIRTTSSTQYVNARLNLMTKDVAVPMLVIPMQDPHVAEEWAQRIRILIHQAP